MALTVFESVECGVEDIEHPCDWGIYCSYEEPIGNLEQLRDMLKSANLHKGQVGNLN